MATSCQLTTSVEKMKEGRKSKPDLKINFKLNLKKNPHGLGVQSITQPFNIMVG